MFSQPDKSEFTPIDYAWINKFYELILLSQDYQIVIDTKSFKQEKRKEQTNRFCLISIEVLQKELKAIPQRKYMQSFITGMNYYIKMV